MTTSKYTPLLKNGEWKFDFNQIKSKVIYEFNKSGNIERTTELIYQDNRLKNSNIFNFSFNKNRKVFYTKSDSTGIIERGNYKWITLYKYELNSINTSGLKNESYANLNNDFRDISGGTKKFENNLLTFEFHYKNNLNKKGILESYTINYTLSGASHTFIILDKAFDDQNNMTEYTVFIEDLNRIHSFNFREIEYYE